MSVKAVKSKEEFDAVIKGNPGKRVVVDFFATWCAPCKTMAPVFKDLAAKYAATCIALSVDVDELEDVASACNVTAMPTFHVYVDGKKAGELIGAQKEKLEDLFHES